MPIPPHESRTVLAKHRLHVMWQPCLDSKEMHVYMGQKESGKGGNYKRL